MEKLWKYWRYSKGVEVLCSNFCRIWQFMFSEHVFFFANILYILETIFSIKLVCYRGCFNEIKPLKYQITLVKPEICRSLYRSIMQPDLVSGDVHSGCRKRWSFSTSIGREFWNSVFSELNLISFENVSGLAPFLVWNVLLLFL